jgi:uncharacterized protein (DUF983 family)
MLKKGNKLYSILLGSCPKCHEESMYINKSAYNLTDTLKMQECCSNCNTKYKIEPSFFFGSMYVSYAVGIALSVATFIISYVFFNANAHITFISIIVVLVMFFPIILRLSRNIWINFFMNFDKNLAKK